MHRRAVEDGHMDRCHQSANLFHHSALPNFHLCTAIAIALSFSLFAYSETVTISRRLIRFDGKPAAGAKVRVLGDYGNFNKNTDFEIAADAGGIFSVDVTQEDSLWVGHLIIKAEGCAIMCDATVTGRRKREAFTPVIHLGAPFNFEGRTTDTKGRPVAGAKVSLVLAEPRSSAEIPFNSTTTHPITTPEFIAHSNTNGAWSMPGIDFVDRENPIPATVVFETVADNQLLASKLDLKLVADSGAPSRKNLPLDFTLAPLIRMAGRVVDSVTAKPVPDVHCARSEIFTSLTGSSSTTDKEGRFELDVPGPLPILWFWIYRDGYAMTTLATAQRQEPTSDWKNSNDLNITVRPMVAVSGRLLDQNGKPPDEPVQLAANYNERINAMWDQDCDRSGIESKVGPDGSFNAKLPAGRVTLILLGPPQQMGSGVGVGFPPKNYRLQQQVDIPPHGMTGLQLTATRNETP